MVQSKRKWKKDSPEKLASRIEKSIEKANEVRLSKAKPKSPEITSPDSKKVRGVGIVPTEFSSDTNLDTSLIVLDSQVSLPEVTPDKMEANKPQIPENGNAKSPAKDIPDPGQSSEGKTITDTDSARKIEDTLNMITQSLAALSSNVLSINNNMVSKTDMSDMKATLEVHEKQIAENSKLLKDQMTKEDGLNLKRKIKDHDHILKSNEECMEKMSNDLKNISEIHDSYSKEKSNMSNRMDGLC